ncbi:DUF7529 family protein [Halobacterium noricense]|uniref:DUF7529 family protein n=1 Tax=Halobacterium noricense TaxID=223182 RepID=UPI001E5163E4|nr:hypothetical protein [Halobacterium noricense]UHH25193.1 hypothetical protein LT974_14585 [Halobacterium noricense]
MPKKPLRDDDLPEEQAERQDRQERLESLEANADEYKQSWTATLEDMHALAEQREAEGWDVLELIAGDTAPMGRDTNDEEGEFGLSYVVGAEDAEAFREVFEAGEFPVYDVYRQTQMGHVFLVTELRDPDTEQVVFVAGAYVQRDEQMCAYTAREEGEMYTHVRKLDGTELGVFRHEGYEKFFPHADRMPDLAEGWTSDA